MFMPQAVMGPRVELSHCLPLRYRPALFSNSSNLGLMGLMLYLSVGVWFISWVGMNIQTQANLCGVASPLFHLQGVNRGRKLA